MASASKYKKGFLDPGAGSSLSDAGLRFRFPFSTAVMTGGPAKLLKRTKCPHCWTTFPPEDVLWISAHSDLLGDPRLGPEQQQRFLPTRFGVDGHALDARGFACQQLACPHCHLPVPRVLLESEPTFLSILGTPACGKSFFLTAMTWELRRLLPLHFALSFTDADPLSNRSLNEYEESLFLNPRADELVPLADLIRKTELQGELYNTVLYGGQTVSYPRPFLFAVQPQPQHANFARAERVRRVLCLYDNAGEHFQTGQDSTSSPVTRHMAQARVLFFLFDPMQDPRFQRLSRTDQGAGPAARPAGSRRQEIVLQEAAARVRRVQGLSQTTKHDRPLIVVVTKYDAWSNLLEESDPSEPWVANRENRSGVDLERVEERSNVLRELLLRICPEVVIAAEDFAREVTYIPVTALGRTPVAAGPAGLAIRPRDIRPSWATVPLLYAMCRWMPGLVPSRKARRKPEPGNGRPADNESSAWYRQSLK
jgi:Double-GTPase 2